MHFCTKSVGLSSHELLQFDWSLDQFIVCPVTVSVLESPCELLTSQTSFVTSFVANFPLTSYIFGSALWGLTQPMRRILPPELLCLWETAIPAWTRFPVWCNQAQVMFCNRSMGAWEKTILWACQVTQTVICLSWHTAKCSLHRLFSAHELTYQLIRSPETQKYELSYIWLFYNGVFTKMFLCKTCLWAVRESADKAACGVAGWSLPLHCQRGKQQQEECLRAVGRTWAPHAVQTRGVWKPLTKRYRAAETWIFHWHTHTNSHACTGSLTEKMCNMVVFFSFT